MKLLFRGKTLCSGELNSGMTSHFFEIFDKRNIIYHNRLKLNIRDYRRLSEMRKISRKNVIILMDYNPFKHLFWRL